MPKETPIVGTGSQPGDKKGFTVKPSFAATVFQNDEVAIELGSIEANGKVYTEAADTTHTITGFTGGFDLLYIYIDDSASTVPNAVIIDSTTGS